MSARGALCLLGLALGLAAAGVVAAGAALAQGLVVERAEDWEALLWRSSGWSGADGIYSIPLSGNDAVGSAAATTTLFVFSDTFIGEVDADDRRLGGWRLVNNTLALLEGGLPDPERMRFLWRRDGEGRAQAVLVPETPEADPGEWYWLMDGLALEGTLHLFALRMREGAGGVFNFAVDGVALVSAAIEGGAGPPKPAQVDTPLHLVPDDGRGELILGAAVMANTAAAGAPVPDGFIYVYGTQNDPFNKKLIVARVRPEDFTDFAQWRYWDGLAWSPDLAAVAALTTRVSSELSVTPLRDGRFALVFQLDTLGRDTVWRIGESPVGPFAPPRVLWTCPEPDLDPDLYCYNAKAHPHLSRPGELIVSYNVNSFDFADHLAHASIYRPRFLRVRLAP